jgi:hypothetical protein
MSLLYPLDRRLVGPQSRSGRHGEEKILDLSEIKRFGKTATAYRNTKLERITVSINPLKTEFLQNNI